VDQVIAKLGLTFSECRTAAEPLLPKSETEKISAIVPPEFSRALVEHACAREWAIYLDDVMVRRTSWHYYHRDAAEKAARVADWMKQLLSWSDSTHSAELGRYQDLLMNRPAADAECKEGWLAANLSRS
jgi:glycerol-3-phosphate dehydrogenase